MPCKRLEILTKKISAGVNLDGGVRLLSLYLPLFHEKFWVAAMHSMLKAWALPFPNSQSRSRLSLWFLADLRGWGCSDTVPYDTGSRMEPTQLATAKVGSGHYVAF